MEKNKKTHNKLCEHKSNTRERITDHRQIKQVSTGPQTTIQRREGEWNNFNKTKQNKGDLTFPVNVHVCLIRYTVSNRSDFNVKRPRVNSAAPNLWPKNAVLHESVLSECVFSLSHKSREGLC